MLTPLRRAIFHLVLLFKSLRSPVEFGAVGALFDSAGQVLLVRQRYSRGWQLPGGGVDRGEPAAVAVLRELREEVGLSGGTTELFAIYTRRPGLVTNVIALYRITEATIAFRPNLEISAVLFADPHNPPPDCTPATLRRLRELAGAAPDPYW